MVKYLAKFERWSFGVHYLHLKNVGFWFGVYTAHNSTWDYTTVPSNVWYKTLKKTPFFNKHLPNSTKNRRGDADFTCKRLFKSYTLQCILRSLLCSVCKTPCASPKHDVGLSLWPVSLKIFGRYLNLTENVSNNFKYPYLIYWAIMFLFVFCFATVGLLWTL